MALTKPADSHFGSHLSWTALLVAAVSLTLAVATMMRAPGASPGEKYGQNSVATSTLDQIKKERVMRVGYGGFPPYTIIDPNATDSNARVSGFIPDIVNEVAKRAEPPIRVEWHRLNWTTLRADMASDRFDFLADAVYVTIPKALDYAFTTPFGYFGIGAAVVRIDDDRFTAFDDLDRDDITIALAQGYVTSDYARNRLSKPEFKIVPIDADAFVQMGEVLAGRADVALNDVPTVAQYVRAHPDKVKALWLNEPPSTVPAGFMMNTGQPELLRFLNSAIEILQADGTFERIDRKWNSLGHFQDRKYRPGAGLVDD